MIVRAVAVKSIRSVVVNKIDNDTFEHEISMCQKLSIENGNHCNWGKCD